MSGPAISDEMVDAFNRASGKVWKERAPKTQGDAVAVDREATRTGLAAALVASGWRPEADVRAEVVEEIARAIEAVTGEGGIHGSAYDHAAWIARFHRVPDCGAQYHGADGGPCPGCGFDIANPCDRATALEPVGAHAQGYAEAVARLRDDARYRDWWTSGGVKPDAPIRRHLADYLETVGPDGPDVSTGRWPAREQAVVRAAIAWRKMRAGITAPAGPRALALMEAVDALPHIDETPAPVAANPTINQALCADGIHEADGPCCSTGVGERPIDLDDRAPRPDAR